MNERLILMGVIGKPHGVRGLVRVHAHTEDPDMLAQYPLTDRTGRAFSLEWLHDNVAQLSELTPAGPRPITDRNAVEKLNLTELYTPRSALPETDEEEFYLTDLIGLSAKSKTGENLGTIAVVHDYGGGASLELSPGARLVPFTRAAVPVVDLARGHVVVIPPAEIVGDAAP
ncbi:MAG TPA: ribosome maturation factor RimM [Acidocella sp.]|nr:ribosome maturation factor RimM [Acidocella sp.]